MTPALRRSLALQREQYAGPVLLYDLAAVRARIERLHALEERHRCRFLFAGKAFGHPQVWSFLAHHGVGLDLSNEGELAQLSENFAGWNRCLVSVTGPNPGLLSRWMKKVDGTLIVNVDSSLQYRGIQSELGEHVKLGARIALGCAARGKATRFGIAPTDEALSELSADPRFCGLHCHIGNEDNGSDTYLEIASSLLRVRERFGLRVRYLNLGGGLHLLQDSGIPLLLERLRAFVPMEIELFFEPGSFWFGGAGYAMTEVLDVRRDPDLVVLDISRECHLRWSTPRLLVPPANGASRRRILFVGPTCYEADVIGSFQVPEAANGTFPVRRGDRLIFSCVSSYSASWNTGFNGIAPAQVVFHGIDE